MLRVQGLKGRGERCRAGIDQSPVGQDFLNPGNTMRRKKRGRVREEQRADICFLVLVWLNTGQARTIIDRDMQILIAHFATLPGSRGTSTLTPAPTRENLALFLHVNMKKLTWPGRS